MSNNYSENEAKKMDCTEICENVTMTLSNSVTNKFEHQTEINSTTSRSVPINVETSVYSKESFETDESLSEGDEWLDILGSGGIMKKTIVDGKSGTQPTKNEKCTINYICSLEDGTIVDSMSNFTFFLGESDVICGLDVAIALLNVGEKCLLKIEPRLAYGAKGFPPKIPPNAVISYEVVLVSVEPEDEIDTLTVHQRQITGNKKRERGNWWYTRGENSLAIQCYRRALDYLNEVESGISKERQIEVQLSDSDLQSLLEDRISVYNNMAAAQIRMHMFDAALNSLQIVIRCFPNNVKAHFRKAKAYIGKNECYMAMKCLREAQELAPEDPEVRKEINKLSKILETQKESERELARRMFNDLKSGSENSNKKNLLKSQNKNKISIWTTMVALVTVGLASLVAHRLKYS